MGAAKERGEKAQHRCSHKAGQSTHRGSGRMVDAAKCLDAECQSQWQGDDARRYTTKDITLQVACIEYILHSQIVIEVLMSFKNEDIRPFLYLSPSPPSRLWVQRYKDYFK